MVTAVNMTRIILHPCSNISHGKLGEIQRTHNRSYLTLVMYSLMLDVAQFGIQLCAKDVRYLQTSAYHNYRCNQIHTIIHGSLPNDRNSIVF